MNRPMAEETEIGRDDVGNLLKLLPLPEARKKIADALSMVQPATERVGADSALGRVCSVNITSSCDIPSVSSSMMDGYAIRSEDAVRADISHPASFRVRGALTPSSAKPTYGLGQCEAYYVATGAPIPPGADAVVKVEETRLSGKSVAVSSRISKWKNVALQGEDVHKGELVAKRGQILNAADMALLIGAGMTEVDVFRRPRVGVLSTGDELARFGSNERGKKINNYSNLISGYLLEAGATPVPLGIAKDDQKHITAMIEEELGRLDALITIGGSSMGVKDFTPRALLGVADCTELFHGVRLVPVKPTGVFMVGRKPVVLLPGHAVSAALSFFAIVRPMVNLLSGLEFESKTPMVKARLSQEVANPRPLGNLFLVTLAVDEIGYLATPLRWGSNLVSSLAKANGFVFAEPRSILRKGEEATVSLLGERELQRAAGGVHP